MDPLNVVLMIVWGLLVVYYGFELWVTNFWEGLPKRFTMVLGTLSAWAGCALLCAHKFVNEANVTMPQLLSAGLLCLLAGIVLRVFSRIGVKR